MTLCVFLELSDTCVNQPHCPHPSGQFYICRSVPSFALFGARAAVAVRGDGLGITLVKQFRQHVPHQAAARAGPAHSLQTAHAGNAVPGHRLADGQQDATTARRTVTPGHASGSCRKGRTPQCAGADQSNAGLANKRATSTCTPTQGPSPRHPAPAAAASAVRPPKPAKPAPSVTIEAPRMPIAPAIKPPPEVAPKAPGASLRCTRLLEKAGSGEPLSAAEQKEMGSTCH